MALTLVSDALKGVRLLGMDTAPTIYFVEKHPLYWAVCDAIFDRVGTDYTLILSAVCYTETLVQPLRSRDRQLARAYTRILALTPCISTPTVSRQVAERAADLRARYNLRSMDALQVATAWTHGCDTFLTNDAALQRVQEVPVLLVSDMRA